MFKIKTISLSNKGYPVNLKKIDKPPKKVYLVGSVTNYDSHAVAIVGSRNMSNYGKRIAEDFSYNLAKNKVTLVSGLARGIDTIVHKSALAAGGRTIAVLGGGLDIIYPPENTELAKEIVKRGAIISEYAVGTKPLPKNFLARNRIIAGLSLVVVVIEGKRRSGTISTAGHAADIGRDVFAIPGPIDSPLSEAPNYLIENGAGVARSYRDILAALDT